jgi:hypothetical protein
MADVSSFQKEDGDRQKVNGIAYRSVSKDAPLKSFSSERVLPLVA